MLIKAVISHKYVSASRFSPSISSAKRLLISNRISLRYFRTLHFLSLNQYKVHSEIDSNNFLIVLQKKVLLESLKYIMSHETGLQKFKGFQNIK